MRGDIGRLGTADLLENNAVGRMKHAKGLLKLAPLGLMLACSTAYASPQPMRVSNVVNDSVTNWAIGIFVVIIGMFIAMIIYDAKKNGRQ